MILNIVVFLQEILSPPADMKDLVNDITNQLANPPPELTADLDPSLAPGRPFY